MTILKAFWKFFGSWGVGKVVQEFSIAWQKGRLNRHQNFRTLPVVACPSFCQKPFLVHPRWHQVWDPVHFHIFQCRYAVCRKKPANSASELSIHGAMLPQIACPESRTKLSFISARGSGWNGAITCLLVMQCLVFNTFVVQSSNFKKLEILRFTPPPWVSNEKTLSFTNITKVLLRHQQNDLSVMVEFGTATYSGFMTSLSRHIRV